MILIPKCEYLIPFASRTRYPGAGDPEDADMKRALVYSQDIIEFVKPKILFQSKIQKEEENLG